MVPGIGPATSQLSLAVYADTTLGLRGMCIGSWLAFGRLNRVLGIDAVCQLPSTSMVNQSRDAPRAAGPAAS